MTTKPTRATPAALAVAGAFFVAYPAIRPFSTEKGLDGARAFASSAWIIAHSLAIVAFVLVGLSVVAASRQLRHGSAGSLGGRAALMIATGIGLTLPYYGAEVFGLHAIGPETLDRNDPTLVAMADKVRFGVGIVFIVGGLLLLAVGAAMLARAIWRTSVLPRSSGVLLAVAFALYLPQFSAPQPVRVLHGVLVLAGCLSLAHGLRRAGTPQPQRRATLVATVPAAV